MPDPPPLHRSQSRLLQVLKQASQVAGLDPYLGAVLEQEPHHGRGLARLGNHAGEFEQARGLGAVDPAQLDRGDRIEVDRGPCLARRAARGLAAAAHDDGCEAAVGGLESHLAHREDGVLKTRRDHGEIAGILRPQLESLARGQ